MYDEVDAARQAGVTVARSLVGNYITSLDMAGCSVTLLRLDDELLRLWDAPVRDAWAAVGRVTVRRACGSTSRRAGPPSADAFAEEVADNRDLLTQLDSAIGDADHGANLDRGMTAVVAALEAEPPTTPGVVLKTAGMTLVSTVGGASGPLLRHALPADVGASAGDAASARRGGVRGAAPRPGSRAWSPAARREADDKTMYDALAPACDALDAAARRAVPRPRRGPGAGERRRRRRPRRHDADAGPQGAGVATSASAASATRTPARPRRRCSSPRPPAPSAERRPTVTGLVVVSHSRALADAAVALAAEMLHGCRSGSRWPPASTRPRSAPTRRRSSTRSTAADDGDGRRRADGPRQRRPVGRARARAGRAGRPRAGRPLPGAAGRGPGRRRGRRRRWRRPGRGRRGGGRLAGGEAGPRRRAAAVGHGSRPSAGDPGRSSTPGRTPMSGAFKITNRARPARPTGRAAGAGGAAVRRRGSELRNLTPGPARSRPRACRRVATLGALLRPPGRGRRPPGPGAGGRRPRRGARALAGSTSPTARDDQPSGRDARRTGQPAARFARDRDRTGALGPAPATSRSRTSRPGPRRRRVAPAPRRGRRGAPGDPAGRGGRGPRGRRARTPGSSTPT